MTNVLLIFLGAGFGGVFRYWVSNGVYWLVGRQFPYGTLVVNISGCFLMGLLFALILDRSFALSSPLRALLLIGLLGGYTTFSSFSIETLNLFEGGAWLSASFNIVLSVILCIAATLIGLLAGRHL
jgi:CrcB protein